MSICEWDLCWEENVLSTKVTGLSHSLMCTGLEGRAWGAHLEPYRAYVSTGLPELYAGEIRDDEAS